MNKHQQLQYALGETWYLARRYGALWSIFAKKVNLKKDYKKPMHLIINELKQRGETQAIQALQIIMDDMEKPYDKERIQSLINYHIHSCGTSDANSN